jgi:methylated-DNA-[protein]-cysteine S-methyltransferase
MNHSDEATVDQLLPKAHRRLESSLGRIRRPQATIGITETGLGPLMVAHGERGLLAVRFVNQGNDPAFVAALRRRFDPIENQAMAAEVGQEVDLLLHGHPQKVAQRPVDLSLVQSDFEQRALRRLCSVPAGAVTTYKALAAASGSPDAQRAVGNTVAGNPIAIYVPCHRVIKSDGSIGNYGGGVERKLALLRAEGFTPDRNKRLPATAVYGHLETRIFCRPTCSAAQRAKRERMIIFAGSIEAMSSGLRPCKLCRPADPETRHG